MATAGLDFSYLKSAPGKKLIMGITGLIWAGFVFGHMAGNLLVFVGSDAFNMYGHFITSGNLIYLVEAVLILALLTHVFCAVSLTLENRKARGISRYQMNPSGEKGVSTASRTMAVQGSLLLVFIITHILAFKFGAYYETTVNGVVVRDLYRLMFEIFSNPLAVGWYLIALVLLGLHLYHGFGSIFQSLGLKSVNNADKINKLSVLYAAVVALGFISQPIYVFLAR